MKLYLVQHGDAVPREVDAERSLSEKGRGDVQRLAVFLANSGVRASRIIHSGKTRARQTAEILAEVVAPGGDTEARSDLNPNDSTDGLVEHIRTGGDGTMVVGHLPFMGKLLSRLVGQREEQNVAVFQPGSVACLERGEEGSWGIAWMLRPEIISK